MSLSVPTAAHCDGAATSPEPKRYVATAYYPPIELNKDGSERPMREFKMRDGHPLFELQPQLHAAGYVYAGTYEHVPRKPPPGFRASPPMRDPIEFRWLDDVHLLVQPTRPPITDRLLGDSAKRTIPRSYSWLECVVLDTLQTHFFQICARDALEVAKPLLQHVPAAHRSRTFFQNGVAGSWYKHDDDRRRTSGFVAFVPKRDGFPAILNVFGMGGNDTLRVAHLLGVRYPHILHSVLASATPCLLIFEMAPPPEFDDAAPLAPGLLGARYTGWSFELAVDTRHASAVESTVAGG